MTTDSKTCFSQRLLVWFDQHGRKDLPWQHPISAYRVWISEIMLQQTQVATVIPYFLAFIEHFPDLATLANSTQDSVLQLWSGLGYYARARNLHKTAQILQLHYGGEFPSDPMVLASLPGIGRSTAGAIASIAFQQPTPILDANVKRVLTRYHAVPGWPGKAAVSEHLWKLATLYTPPTRVADYTQAIMDLGATLCTRNQPKCTHCPLSQDCMAYAAGEPETFPHKKPSTTKRPTQSTQMLLLINPSNNCVLLEKRPPSGIWGGLWSLPEYRPDAEKDATALKSWCHSQYGVQCHTIRPGTPRPHAFSHFLLQIQPVFITITPAADIAMESSDHIWYHALEGSLVGLPAPVAVLLKEYYGVVE